MKPTFSRRQALLLGVGAVPLLGAPARAAVCADPAKLSTHTALGVGGATFYYEVTGKPATIKIDEPFFQRLVQWRLFYDDNNPWSVLTRLWNYGAYVNRNDGCVSWHNAGRAFDISRGYGTDNALQFSCRYDLWRNYATPTMELHRRRYWAAAASMHHHFEYVLTYLYNADHHNHIHVDNSQSGTGYSTFGTDSGTQVRSTQAMLSYVWGYATTIDGVWGTQTDTNSARVLTRIGKPGHLTTGQAHWLAFLRATCRKGTGLQAY